MGSFLLISDELIKKYPPTHTIPKSWHNCFGDRAGLGRMIRVRKMRAGSFFSEEGLDSLWQIDENYLDMMGNIWLVKPLLVYSLALIATWNQYLLYAQNVGLPPLNDC